MLGGLLGGLVQQQPGAGAQPTGGLLGGIGDNSMTLAALGMGLLSGENNRDAFRLGIQGAMQGRQLDAQMRQQRQLQQAQMAASQDPNLNPQARALIAAGYAPALQQYAESMFRAPSWQTVRNADGSTTSGWIRPGDTNVTAVGAPSREYQAQQVPQRDGTIVGTTFEPSTGNWGGQARPPSPPSYQSQSIPPVGGAAPQGGQQRTAQGAPNVIGGRAVADDESGARRELDRATQTPRQVVDQWNRMVEGARQGTGAGDIAMMFTFMRMLDPDSVVREGETVMIRNAAGLPAWVVAHFNRLQGEGQLSDDARREILHAARPYMEDAQRQLGSRTEHMRGVARSNNWNPDNVAGPTAPPLEIPELFRQPPRQNARAQGPAPASQQPPPNVGWRRAQQPTQQPTEPQSPWYPPNLNWRFAR